MVLAVFFCGYRTDFLHENIFLHEYAGKHKRQDSKQKIFDNALHSVCKDNQDCRENLTFPCNLNIFVTFCRLFCAD